MSKEREEAAQERQTRLAARDQVMSEEEQSRWAHIMLKVDADIQGGLGWSAVGVMATVEDPTLPFTYTIGFREHDLHPELILVGMSPTQAHPLLGILYDRVSSGERFEDGQTDSRVLEGYDVKFKALPPDGRPLNVARHFYGLDELPALQVVWPDTNGVFPDEDGFEERFVGWQDLDQIREED